MKLSERKDNSYDDRWNGLIYDALLDCNSRIAYLWNLPAGHYQSNKKERWGLSILKEQFARGEISEEEYEK